VGRQGDRSSGAEPADVELGAENRVCWPEFQQTQFLELEPQRSGALAHTGQLFIVSQESQYSSFFSGRLVLQCYGSFIQVNEVQCDHTQFI
jgi:hypothetical protein